MQSREYPGDECHTTNMLTNMALMAPIWRCFRLLEQSYRASNSVVFFAFHSRPSFLRKGHGLTPPCFHVQSSRTITSTIILRNEDSSNRLKVKQSVLLVDETGKNLGETSLKNAANIAREKSLDLMWINKQNKAALPVYKMIRKIDIKAKALKTPKIKNIEVSDRIESRDLSFRLNQIQRWLEKGHQVKVSVKSKGKNEEDKWNIIRKVEQELEEAGVLSGRPTEDSPRQISCIFKPYRGSNDV